MNKSVYRSTLNVGRFLSPLLLLALCNDVAHSHEVITTKITWAREVSRIFYRRCTSCHHNGGDAFDLSTYEQARPWAEAIKEEVLERRMPPWGAVKGFGDFRNDAGLTEEEIALISGWAQGGAPMGDAKLLPDNSDTRLERLAPPKTGGSVLVKGVLTLETDVIVIAIRPETLPEGACVRLVAERPDGSVEPLIWLYKYAPRFRPTYYFRAPLSFRVGTRIRMEPASGAVSLLLPRR